eukprot:5075696-Pyramimonas_sp.AAC.1
MGVPTAAGVLHKAMWQDPVPAEEIIQGATVVFQPRDVVDLRAKPFRDLWTKPASAETDTRIIHAFAVAREAA